MLFFIRTFGKCQTLFIFCERILKYSLNDYIYSTMADRQWPIYKCTFDIFGLLNSGKLFKVPIYKLYFVFCRWINIFKRIRLKIHWHAGMAALPRSPQGKCVEHTVLDPWRWQKYSIWNDSSSWKELTSVDCLCSQLYHRTLVFVSA